MFIELFKKLEIDQGFTNRQKIEIMEYYLKRNVVNVKGMADYDYKHEIKDGCYKRSILIPAGDLVIGLVHKTEHMNYLISGTATIISDDFLFTSTGLKFFSSKAGTKKAVYAHTDVEYATTHFTNKTNLQEIMRETVEESDLSWIENQLMIGV